MSNETTSSAPPDPSVTMIHGGTGANIKNSKLTNSGRDTIKNVYNNYNFGSENPAQGVISFFQVLVQCLSSTSKGQSTGVDGSEPLPKAVDTDYTTQLEDNQVDICDLVPPDPSAFPVASIADRYTRSMLGLSIGYPLYEPKPYSQHSKKYPCDGINIGDVGFVREDGTFDFLFNICPPNNSSVNPLNLPKGTSLETPDHSATREMEPILRGKSFPSLTVTKMKSGKYRCKEHEGAVLVLPEGAIQYDTINKGRFEDLAKRHGVEWYKYTKTLGRRISNGSLYLVTSITKCTQLGIAVFDRPCEPGQGVKFCRKSCFPCCKSSPKYRWKGSSALFTKVASPDPDQKDVPNQCVFLRGFKIMIRKDIFDELSSLPQAGSSGGPSMQRVLADRMRGGASGGGTNLMSIFTRTRTKTPTVAPVDLHANFNSPPIHPLDLFNTALLSQNPRAKVALVHDDVWCDLLRDIYLELDHATLINITQSYATTVDDDGHISLKKISDSIKDESSLGSHTLQEPIQQKRPTSNEENIPVPTENPIPSVQERNDNMGHAILYEIHEDTVTFHLGDGHYTEQERSMIRNHFSNVVAFTMRDINNILNTMRSDSLPPPILSLSNPHATYGDYQIKNKHGLCLKGSRVPLLQEMADWVSGADETRIFVLSGPGEIGKSTVAYTIASRADVLGLLGSSFFFSRDDADRDNGKMFFTAIAYQLCLYSKLFAKAIEIALLTKPLSNATTMDPQEQLKVLLLEPLRNIDRSRIRPILIVVDALDECEEEDGLLVLAGLSQLVQDLPSFKVILTTRPQSHFNRFFHHKIFHLQDITRSYHEPSLSQAREQSQDRKEGVYASDSDIAINDDTFQQGFNTIPSSASSAIGPFTHPMYVTGAYDAPQPVIPARGPPATSTPMPDPVRTDTLIHILLAFMPSPNPSILLYDFIDPPSMSTFSLRSSDVIRNLTWALDEAATSPPVLHMTICCSRFPWIIRVSASSASKGHVTVNDVLVAIYYNLRNQVTRSEYEASRNHIDVDRAAQAYRDRYTRLRDRQEHDAEKLGGMRRIDFLMGRTRFGGLSISIDHLERGEWVLSVIE